MHALETEFRELNAQGIIDDATTSRAVALDRGEVLSLHGELRATLYAGVLLVMAGVGTILARNLDRLGPLVIVLAIALAASACAIPAARARLADRMPGVAADYLLLLAVLLASADLAYAEQQFRLLGPLWPWHLLLLAVAGAAVAYAFRSALVLAAALTALAGWFGVGGSVGDAFHLGYSTPQLGGRALACASMIAAWRFADRHWRPDTRFSAVFDHFFTNLAFWGALAWCLEWPWLVAGLPLLAGFAYASIRRGLETGREVFLVYGVGYAALGACFVIVPRVAGDTAELSFVLLIVCVAATALWQLRRRLKEPAP